MKFFNVEKGSEKWFGALVLLLSLMLIFTSLGKTNWLIYISGIFSIILGIFLWTEGGIRDYLKRKGYKHIDGNDVIIWMAFIFGTFLILNGITLFLGNLASGWFFDFIRTSGVIGGLISGILSIFLLLTPRPKA